MPHRARGVSVHAVLFDLDGTLLDSFEQHWRSLAAALTESGFQSPSPERIRRLMGLPGHETIATLGVPQEQVHAVWLSWIEWERRLSHLARPFPGVVPLLGRLRDAGCRLGIVTSRARVSVETTQAALDLLPCVELLVTREDTSEGKPHPAPLLHAFRQLGLGPEKGVYVGDASYDIEAGRRAGCLTVLATWDGAARDPLPEEPEPDFVAASVDELTAWLLDRGGNI
jgi:HAD superfamily hydrolase (TIGR01549 family)